MPLITVGHPSMDEEFCRCYRFCRERRLFAFGQVAEVRQPPMPVDSPLGPAPILDWDSRKAAADRIRDTQIAKAREAQKERGEIRPDDEGNDSLRKERLDKVAAQTADFERQLQESQKITADLSVRGSRNETRDRAPVVEATRDEILTRLAEENAEQEARRAEAKRIQDAHLAEAEERRQKLEAPAKLERVNRSNSLHVNQPENTATPGTEYPDNSGPGGPL